MKPPEIPTKMLYAKDLPFGWRPVLRSRLTGERLSFVNGCNPLTGEIVDYSTDTVYFGFQGHRQSFNVLRFQGYIYWKLCLWLESKWGIQALPTHVWTRHYFTPITFEWTEQRF